MDVVPDNAKLVVTAMVQPRDIDHVRVGMTARVRLTALNQRWTNPIPAKVVTVSADRIVNEKTGQGFFRVDLRIDPKDLRHLPKEVKLSPGMPADGIIVTGKRTVMGFLISPLTDTIHNAFRED
jgi:multidrug efflux pump subunit AcrA (membrane-fusion protein)